MSIKSKLISYIVDIHQILSHIGNINQHVIKLVTAPSMTKSLYSTFLRYSMDVPSTPPPPSSELLAALTMEP